MGQARNRGTPEQRRAEAEQKEFELNITRKEHLVQLEEAEKQSESMVRTFTMEIVKNFLDNTAHEKLSRRNRERPTATIVVAD